jgi:hypothetical protein
MRNAARHPGRVGSTGLRSRLRLKHFLPEGPDRKMADPYVADSPAAWRSRHMAARSFVLPALGLALFAAAIWAVHCELGAADLGDLGRAPCDLPASAVLLSLLAAGSRLPTAASSRLTSCATGAMPHAT